jgi:hypothetical protein
MFSLAGDSMTATASAMIFDQRTLVSPNKAAEAGFEGPDLEMFH